MSSGTLTDSSHPLPRPPPNTHTPVPDGDEEANPTIIEPEVYDNMGLLAQAIADQCVSIPEFIMDPVYFSEISIMYTAFFAVFAMVRKKGGSAEFVEAVRVSFQKIRKFTELPPYCLHLPLLARC